MEIKKTFRILLIILILATSVSCDQISKNIARNNIEYNEQINIIHNLLTLTKVENTGAFLSLGDAIPRTLYKILLIILPLLVLGYALFYLITKENLSKSIIIASSLLVGGGISNLYDRIMYGSVTDFLHMDFIIFQTGIFNLADVLIMTGAFIILFESTFRKNKLVAKDS